MIKILLLIFRPFIILLTEILDLSVILTAFGSLATNCVLLRGNASRKGINIMISIVELSISDSCHQ